MRGGRHGQTLFAKFKFCACARMTINQDSHRMLDETCFIDYLLRDGWLGVMDSGYVFTDHSKEHFFTFSCLFLQDLQIGM